MTLAEVTRALRQLRVSGMAATLEARLLQAQAEKWAPIDLISALVQDELTRRQDRLLERRIKKAEFRDAGKTLDTFDFEFNKKMDRALLFELDRHVLRPGALLVEPVHQAPVSCALAWFRVIGLPGRKVVAGKIDKFFRGICFRVF